MTNYTTGHLAEKKAADYLSSQGFRVKELNWKTRWCEIDIVAEKEHTMYFVEVKYRTKQSQGDGFAYITPKKLKQMKFAAEFWLANSEWSGDAILAVIAASPAGFEFIEL